MSDPTEDPPISPHDSAAPASPERPFAARHETHAGRRPRLPRDDDFYSSTDGFEDLAPGTVLRSRDVQLAFLGLVPQPVRAVQLNYRTTDLRGDPMVAVTTVLVPDHPDDDRPTPIVSYQCAIDAVTGRCFPSYALRRGAKAIGALPQLEFLLISALLAEGWAVSVPDHEGPKGLWGLPFEPGYVALDGIRAALSFAPLGLRPDAPVGLWGYSGGGLATAWAAEMYDAHAPELNLVGAVLGSPVGDLGNTYTRLNGTFWSGLPALVVSALRHVYPELDRIIDAHATESGRVKLARLQSMTTVEAVVRFMFTDMDAFLDTPLDEVLALPEVRRVFDSLRLGQSPPTVPVLLVQACNDRIVAVDDIDALARTYAAAGTDVTYHRDRFSEHMLMHPMSAPTALRWLRDRMDGRPVDERRRRTAWPTLLNPSTYLGVVRLASISAKVFSGRPIPRRKLSELDR
ncbi:triacylglycerol lipase [Williamsia serinedens]|uniref:Triacylglycerol lipase n=1 Tax=Williamsia serinedens TaxID=391736 RepID=A0ABT1H2Q3_9NOCA|nr:lipase family protein [Williamsia serinedens]MCP2160013.1 triacylglycerol lipase [Williamsia serinedens]